MSSLPTLERLSPVHEALEGLKPHWDRLGGMPVALHFGDAQAEANHAGTVSLCDASALARLTVKGPGAEAFLIEQGLNPPTDIYAHAPLEHGGLLARTGGAEFFLEDGPRGATVAALSEKLALPRSGVCRVLRQDASFLLGGSEVLQVLAETCGVDFRASGSHLVFSRVAGVSCSILKRSFQGADAFQLWLDGTYGPYLWHTLLEIVVEGRGGPVGLSRFFPELSVNAALKEERT